MAYRLPSLNALRAFEAAARHLSFTRAADELCVTQGAISRHISILEDSLGVRLFIRTPRHVELTTPAEAYLQAIRSAFDTIDAATRTLTSKDESLPLRVTALPTFASRWLLPRLHRLNELHPEIMIRLGTFVDPVSVQREQVDISIEGSISEMPDISSDRLLDVELIPVCSPTMVNGMRPPSEISELSRYTLIHTLLRADFWPYWMERVGAPDLEAAPSSYFPSSALVYQAVKEGLGIGMGIKCFIEDDLASGTLVAPFDQSVFYPAAYFMNIPVSKLRTPRVATFRRWILSEAQASMPSSPT